MFFAALATDYDGTLAHDGIVDRPVIEALERFKAAHRRLILVTGRELPHLKAVFPEFHLFDRIVAENGAVVFDPATEREKLIAPSPPPSFVEALKTQNIAPLSVGRSIVATWEPHEQAVLDTIRRLGLELQIIFNKGAVMVLPAGVNKASGLAAALNDLELSPHNVVGVGDAENDHAFLAACGCSVAVANALPMLKERADIVTKGERGEGVIELLARIEQEDAALIKPGRHGIRLGSCGARDILFEPQNGDVLIAGSSGMGKSTVAIALTERMAEGGYQFCVFDPEGDYNELENAVSVGDPKTAPRHDELVELLKRHTANVAINTLALPVEERPRFFAKLLPDIAGIYSSNGRPHWLVIDEAHHLMPVEKAEFDYQSLKSLPAAVLITVNPESLAREALQKVRTVVALGEKASAVIAAFCEATMLPAPPITEAPGNDEVLVWRREWDRACIVQVVRPRQTHKRHTRKYAEGALGPDRSFYFRGADGALNLRAQNLMLFVQIAEGVDENTWQFHRERGDYSSWIRDAIKDEELARQIATIEGDRAVDARQSRTRIADAIRARYTVPAASE